MAAEADNQTVFDEKQKNQMVFDEKQKNQMVFDKSKNNPTLYFKMFYDYSDAIDTLSDAAAGRLLKALFRYGKTGRKEGVEKEELFAFTLLKTYIDKDIEGYKHIHTVRQESGKKGGRPRKDRAEEERQIISDKKQKKQMVFEKSKIADNRQEIIDRYTPDTLTGVGGQQPSTAHTQKKFTPPTVDEVREFCAERKNDIDAAYFIDYYTARGWKLTNGRTMADWKAAVRTWEKRDKEAGKPLGNRRDNPKNNYEQHPDSDTAEAMRNADAELMQEAQALT